MAKYEYIDFGDLKVGQFFKAKGDPHIYQVDDCSGAQRITGKNAGEINDLIDFNEVRVIRVKITEIK